MPVKGKERQEAGPPVTSSACVVPSWPGLHARTPPQTHRPLLGLGSLAPQDSSQ